MLNVKRWHVCPYCKRRALRSAIAIAENPFCGKCLHERINASGPYPYRVDRIYENGRVRFVRVATEEQSG